MAGEVVPPSVVAEVNQLRNRIYELQRRLATGGARGVLGPPTDFDCLSTTVVGSLRAFLQSDVGYPCNGSDIDFPPTFFQGYLWLPVVAAADGD